VRRLLFPNLPPEEGWTRIERALEGAKDAKRMEAIEELAEGNLTDDLVAVLRRLHGGRGAEPQPPDA
jgi:hypothetical protein